ncbi:MAG: DUF1932 domain-containing protein [Pseudomonadales bacterium]
MTITGVINPGEMGASVGAAAAACGHRVLWASAHRSPATRERATQAKLEDCKTLARLVEACDVILSVCPPHSAEQVARDVAALGFDGLYLDGNAIAPDRARAIEQIITASGAQFIDGGIIGGPAWDAASNTTLHLSGQRAGDIAKLFTGSPLKTNVVSARTGAASALKMSYAAYTKGTTALLSAILGVAETEGVRADLEAQWGEDFTAQTHRRVTANTAKAWRFVGEMEEIAATFRGAGLHEGFHSAAADTFQRLADFKDTNTPTIEELLVKLLGR